MLLKGGHLPGDDVVDLLATATETLVYRATRIVSRHTHGTGCTYSAAICAALALGHDLPRAVALGKNFITQAISDSYKIGRHFALRNF